MKICILLYFIYSTVNYQNSLHARDRTGESTLTKPQIRKAFVDDRAYVFASAAINKKKINLDLFVPFLEPRFTRIYLRLSGEVKFE